MSKSIWKRQEGKESDRNHISEETCTDCHDSRIRLMSMDTFGLISKYKGLSNRSMQLRASLSSDKRYITCGSDDGNV
mgnify:CR=1 FL=1